MTVFNQFLLAKTVAKPCDNKRQSHVNEEPVRETIKVHRGFISLNCVKNCLDHQATHLYRLHMNRQTANRRKPHSILRLLTNSSFKHVSGNVLVCQNKDDSQKYVKTDMDKLSTAQSSHRGCVALWAVGFQYITFASQVTATNSQ